MEQLLKPHVLKKKIIETLEEEAQKQMNASAKMPMSSEEPTGIWENSKTWESLQAQQQAGVAAYATF